MVEISQPSRILLLTLFFRLAKPRPTELYQYPKPQRLLGTPGVRAGFEPKSVPKSILNHSTHCSWELILDILWCNTFISLRVSEAQPISNLAQNTAEKAGFLSVPLQCGH
jgi:hypothetical protein